MLLGQVVAGGLKGLKPGTKIVDTVLGEYTPGQWRQIAVKATRSMAEIEALNKQFDESMKRLQDASRARSRSCSAAMSCRRA
jgi:DNA-directed RNA polymerase subunit beta